MDRQPPDAIGADDDDSPKISCAVARKRLAFAGLDCSEPLASSHAQTALATGGVAPPEASLAGFAVGSLTDHCPVTCGRCGPVTNAAWAKPTAADAVINAYPPALAVDGCKQEGHRSWISGSRTGHHWLAVDLGSDVSARAIILTAGVYRPVQFGSSVQATIGLCTLQLQVLRTVTSGDGDTLTTAQWQDLLMKPSNGTNSSSCIAAEDGWYCQQSVAHTYTVLPTEEANSTISAVRLFMDQRPCGGDYDAHARVLEVEVIGPCPSGGGYEETEGLGCAQINPCSSSPPSCPLHSSCFHSGPGSYVCSCTIGWANQYVNDSLFQCVDAAPPVLVCPSAISASAQTGMAFAQVIMPAATVTDNSDEILSVDARESESTGYAVMFMDAGNFIAVFSIGAHNVTFFATDSQNLTGYCEMTVTILDEEAPSVSSCLHNLTVAAAPWSMFALVDLADAVDATDNSGAVTLTAVLNSAGTILPADFHYPLGEVTEITIRITDASNNSAFCESISIRVTDYDECGHENGFCAPVIACTNGVGFRTCGDCPDGLYGNRWPIICHLEDPCNDDLAAEWPGTDLASHTCAEKAACHATSVGAYSCTCLDGYVGDGFHCADVAPPVLMACHDVIAQTRPGDSAAEVDLPAITIRDNSEEVITLMNVEIRSANRPFHWVPNYRLLFEMGETMVTYSAEDAVGNLGSCTFRVSVFDREPPVLTCSDATATAEPFENSAEIPVAPPHVFENSGGAVSMMMQYDYVYADTTAFELNFACVEPEPCRGTWRLITSPGKSVAVLRCVLPDPAALPSTVTTTISLAGDLASIGAPNSTTHADFVGNFTADMAAAIGVVPARIVVDSIGAGGSSGVRRLLSEVTASIVVVFSVRPDSNGLPVPIVAITAAFAGPGVWIAGTSTTTTIEATAVLMHADNCPASKLAELSTVLPSCCDADTGADCDRAVPTTCEPACNTAMAPFWANCSATIAGMDASGQRRFGFDVAAMEVFVNGLCPDGAGALSPVTASGDPVSPPELPAGSGSYSSSSFGESWESGSFSESWESSSVGGSWDPGPHGSGSSDSGSWGSLWGGSGSHGSASSYGSGGSSGFRRRLSTDVCTPSLPVQLTNSGRLRFNKPLSYVNGSDCDWMLRCSNASRSPRLTLTAFTAESEFDALAVFSGDSDATPQLAQLHTSDAPVSITGGGPMVLLRFNGLDIPVNDRSWDDSSESWSGTPSSNSTNGTYAADKTIAVNGTGAANQTDMPSTSDQTLARQYNFSLGITHVLWTVTDESENTAVCVSDFTVLDFDECSGNNGGCSNLVKCTNLPGGRECGSCPLGWVGDGFNCTAINPCEERERALCSTHGTCSQVGPGEYTCACFVGYGGNGTFCSDVEPPTITCVSAMSTGTNTGSAHGTVVLPNATAVDSAMGLVTIAITSNASLSIGQNATFPMGVTTIAYTATDASMNSASCDTVVSVVDDEAPVILNCTNTFIIAGPFESQAFALLQPVSALESVAPIHEYNGDPLLRPRQGVRVEIWNQARQPVLPIDLDTWYLHDGESALGSRLATEFYDLINVSATLQIWDGFRNLRDRFFARFTSHVLVEDAGQYAFWVSVSQDDDLAHLRLGGTAVAIDGGQLVLGAGFTYLSLQYSELEGHAELVLWWLPPTAAARAIIPAEVFHCESQQGYPAEIRDNSGHMPSLHILRDGIEILPTAVFPFGETGLSFVARDAAGNEANCDMTVTVVDNDECTFDNGGCDPQSSVSVCTDTIGSRACSPCPRGYRGDSYVLCDGIDPCIENTHNCSDYFAECQLDAPGIFSCVCAPGFDGDGYEDDTVVNAGCLDVQPPNISCPHTGFLDNGTWVTQPSRVVMDADPDHDSIYIWVPPPNVSDNSGTVHGISVLHSSGFDAAVGELVEIKLGESTLTYTAQDPTLNFASCSMLVEILGYVGIIPSHKSISLPESSVNFTVNVTIELGYPPNSSVLVHTRFDGVANDNLVVHPTTVVFNESNWNLSVTFSVSVMDTAEVEDRGISYSSNLTFFTTNVSDPRFADLSSREINVTVLDDDDAGLVLPNGVHPQLTVDEGSFFSYEIALRTQPTDLVTVTVVSDENFHVSADFSESPTLVFTTANWSAPQTVTLLAVDDIIDEGDAELHVLSHRLSSCDPFYNTSTHQLTGFDGYRTEAAVQTVSVDIQDNDVAPMPDFFGILSIPLGPTTGGTDVSLSPLWIVVSPALEASKRALYGLFAEQFRIYCRVYDVPRQIRYVCPKDCAWNETSASVICESPFIVYPGPVNFEVRVRYSRLGGTDWISAYDTYIYHNPAILNQMTPASGPLQGGTSIQISAQNVDDSSPSTLACIFGRNSNVSSIYRAPAYMAGKHVNCVAPEVSSPGLSEVRLSMNGIQFSPTSLMYQFYDNNCSITSVDLDFGPLSGGSSMLIQGINFVDTGTIRCFFNYSAFGSSDYRIYSSAGTFMSKATLTCVTPAVGAVGRAVLTLSMNGQENCMGQTASFSFYAEPVVSALMPNNAAIGGGPPQPIVLAADLWVYSTIFCKQGAGGTPVEGAVLNSTHATCDTSASEESGPISIFVSLNGQQYVQLGPKFYFRPILNSIGPALGPVDGGTLLFVTGEGFTPGIMQCRTATGVLTDAHVLNSTALSCETGSSAVDGPIFVAVTSDGIFFETSSANGTFYYHTQPQIVSLSRYSIPKTGRILLNIIIAPMQLPGDPMSYVRLKPKGGAAPLALELSGNLVDYAVRIDIGDLTGFGDTLSGDVAVEISLNGVDYSRHSLDLNVFDALRPPAVTSMRPASGPMQGNTSISLRGSNIARLSSLQCKFLQSLDDLDAGEPASAAFISSGEATCVTPNYYNAGNTSAVVYVLLSNLGSDWSALTNDTIYRYSPTQPWFSESYGSGLGQSEVDIVVAGTMATFRIDSKVTMTDHYTAGGDVFYVDLMPVGLTDSSEISHGTVFDLDPAFTKIDESLEENAHRLVALAAAVNASVVSMVEDVSLAEQSYVDAFALLVSMASPGLGFSVSAFEDQEAVAEREVVDRAIARAALASGIEAAQMAAAEAEEAWRMFGESMFPNTMALYEAVTIASHTYNAYYCGTFETVHECCIASAASCARIEDTIGSHLAAYNLTVSGTYDISIFNGGAHIGESPYHVTVYPAALDEVMSTVSGLSGQRLVAGEAIQLLFQPRDVYGNMRGEPLDGTEHIGKGENITVALALQTGLKAREIGWYIEDLASAEVLYRVYSASYADDTLYTINLTLPSRAYRLVAMASGGRGWHNARLSLINKVTRLAILDVTLGNFGPNKALPFVIGVKLEVKCQEILIEMEPEVNPEVAEAHTSLAVMRERLAAAEEAGESWNIRGYTVTIHGLENWLAAEAERYEAEVSRRLAYVEALPSVSTIGISVHKPTLTGEGASPDIPVYLESVQAGSFQFRFSVNGVALPSVDRMQILFISAITSAFHSLFTAVLDPPCIAGHICASGIIARDRFGNVREHGADVFVGVARTSRMGLPVAVAITIVDHGDSTYALEFYPTVSGLYDIDVRLNNSAVGGGVVTILVKPDILHVPSTTVIGTGTVGGMMLQIATGQYGPTIFEGMETVVAGGQMEYRFQCRDQFANNRSTNDGTFALSIHRGASISLRSCTNWGSSGFIGSVCGDKPGQTTCNSLTCQVMVGRAIWNCTDYVIFDRDTADEEAVPVMRMCPAMCGICETVIYTFTTDYIGSGQYNGSYEITLAGIIQHTVTLYTAADPLLAPDVLVIPAATDMFESIISGEGLDSRVAGRWTSIELQLKDCFGNVKIYGGETDSLSLDFVRGSWIETNTTVGFYGSFIHNLTNTTKWETNTTVGLSDTAGEIFHISELERLRAMEDAVNSTYTLSIGSLFEPTNLSMFWSHHPEFVTETVEWTELGLGRYSVRYLFVPATAYFMSLRCSGQHFRPVSPFTVNKTKAPAPALVHSRFASSLTHIVAEFDVPTNMAGSLNDGKFNCTHMLKSSILSPAGSTCAWAAPTTLLVWNSHVNSTLAARLSAEVAPTPLQIGFHCPVNASCEEVAIRTWFDNSETASAVSNLTLPPNIYPQMVLQGPRHVGECDDFFLSAARTHGAGPMTFSWAALNNQYQFLTSARSLLGTFIGRQSSADISIAAADLIVGRNYEFNITATNAVGLSSSATWNISRVATTIPMVQMDIPHKQIATHETAVLSAKATLPCGTREFGRALRFEWKQILGPVMEIDEPSSKGLALKIPADTLQAGHDYRFMLTAFVAGNPSLNASCITDVRASPRELVVRIGGGGRTISNETFLRLHATIDGATDEQTVASSFLWSCRMLDVDDTVHPCANATGSELEFPSTDVLEVLTMAAGPETIRKMHPNSPAEYLFTVTVISGAGGLAPVQHAVASTTVVVTPARSPAVHIEGAPPGRVLVSDQVVLHAFVPFESEYWWTTDRYDMLDVQTQSSEFLNSFVLRPGALAPGLKYNFYLNVIDATGMIGFAIVEIATNMPPCCGDFSVVPGQGEALSTGFVFHADSPDMDEWVDDVGDMPLAFAYSYSKDLSHEHLFRQLPRQFHQNLSTILPIGASNNHVVLDGNLTVVDIGHPLHIRAHVSDIFGATTVSTPYTISVRPPNSTVSPSEIISDVLDGIVADAIARGSIGEIVALCLSALDVFNDLVGAEDVYRRALQSAADVHASRRGVRDRLAKILLNLVHVAPASTIMSQLALLRLVSAAPCELSDFAAQATFESLQLNLLRLDSTPAANGLAAANNLVMASDSEFCPIITQPACSSSCNGRGSCVNGECQCFRYDCVEARCFFVPIVGEMHSCDAPQPDHCDSTGQCYNVNCSPGHCPPFSSTCNEGYCVPDAGGGQACYVGRCPLNLQYFEQPECRLTAPAAAAELAADLHRRECLLRKLTTTVDGFASVAATALVAGEPAADYALSGVGLTAASIRVGATADIIMLHPPKMEAAAHDGTDCHAVQMHTGGCSSGELLYAWAISWEADPFFAAELPESRMQRVSGAVVMSLSAADPKTTCFEPVDQLVTASSGSGSGSGSWGSADWELSEAAMVVTFHTAVLPEGDLHCLTWDRDDPGRWSRPAGCSTIRVSISHTRCACRTLQRTLVLGLFVDPPVALETVHPPVVNGQITHYKTRAASLLVVYSTLIIACVLLLLLDLTCAHTVMVRHQEQKEAVIAEIVRAERQHFGVGVGKGIASGAADVAGDCGLAMVPVPSSAVELWSSTERADERAYGVLAIEPGSPMMGSSMVLAGAKAIGRGSFEGPSSAMVLAGGKTMIPAGCSKLEARGRGSSRNKTGPGVDSKSQWVSVQGKGRCTFFRKICGRQPAGARKYTVGKHEIGEDGPEWNIGGGAMCPARATVWWDRVVASHPMAKLVRATPADSAAPPQQIASMACALLGVIAGCAAVVAGDDDCLPNWHFADCKVGCGCVPAPEEDGRAPPDLVRVLLAAFAAAVAAWPLTPMFSALFVKVRRHPRAGAKAQKGPAGRTWAVHDFATDRRAVTLLQVAI